MEFRYHIVWDICARRSQSVEDSVRNKFYEAIVDCSVHWERRQHSFVRLWSPMFHQQLFERLALPLNPEVDRLEVIYRGSSLSFGQVLERGDGALRNANPVPFNNFLSGLAEH